MRSPLRTSAIRLGAGAVLALTGLTVLIFVLPDASEKRSQSQKAASSAMASLQRQQAELEAAQAEVQRLRTNRKALDDLMEEMPAEPVGHLTWRLSKVLYDLSAKHSVRLVNAKYGAPAKEGTKGLNLEAVDVEFTVTGIFQNLKGFMQALESSKVPFAVAAAKLDESPDGAQLNIVLRAFRQTQASPTEPQAGENP